MWIRLDNLTFWILSVHDFFFLSHGCGILVPQPEIELGLLALKAWSPNHWMPGSS